MARRWHCWLGNEARDAAHGSLRSVGNDLPLNSFNSAETLSRRHKQFAHCVTAFEVLDQIPLAFVLTARVMKILLTCCA